MPGTVPGSVPGTVPGPTPSARESAQLRHAVDGIGTGRRRRSAPRRGRLAAAAQPCGGRRGGGEREAADLLERRDPVLERRVGVEHAAQARAQALVVAQRRLDVEMRRRPRHVLQRLVVVAQRGQGQRQPLGVAGELHGGRVGQILAAAGERHLQERRADRRQHGGDQADRNAERPEAALAAVGAAEDRDPHQHVGCQRDRPDQHRGDAHQLDVAVADVAHLVREHALQLPVVHQRQQPRRDRDVRVPRVAPGRERVRRAVVDQVEIRRLRQTGGDRDVLEQPVDPRLILLRDRLRVGDGGDDPAGREVRDQPVADHEDAEHAGQPRAVRAADDRDERQDQHREAEEHHRGAPPVRPDLLLERHGFERSTATGARSPSSSSSKNSRGLNPSAPAIRLVGNVCCEVLYRWTTLL